MKWGPAIALLFFAMPTLASAQVVINEIMYNPQGSDSGREWVELYNEGQSDVTMVGGTVKGSWRLSDGTNHTLTDPSGGTGRGSLTVPAGGYLIVASDPNDFISGEYAGGSFSVVKAPMSLNNTGATVSLIDGAGAVADSVAYTSAQGGSDDGTSLQRQADGSWLAALPTPGAQNSITAYTPPPSETNNTNAASTTTTGGTTQTQSQTQTAPTQSYVPPPTPDLFVDAGGDRTVIVGADAEFDASAYDKSQDLLDPSTVRFMWNFGDGSTAEGAAVLHHFSYPGTYAVILDIAQQKNAASDEMTVTAEPAALAFSLLPDGGVGIENLAGHDLDLSEWLVRADQTSFAAQFMLPEHSEILSGSSIRISSQTLSFRASSSTLLEYPNGVFALSMGDSASNLTEEIKAAPVAALAATGAAPPPRAPVITTPSDPASSSDDEIGFDDSDSTSTDSVLDDSATDATETILQTAGAGAAPASKYLWWLGIASLALAAGAAALAFTRFKKGEWDIVEDKSE